MSLYPRWITNVDKNNVGELKGGIIGYPMGTSAYSARQLFDMGLVGVYAISDDFEYLDEVFGEKWRTSIINGEIRYAEKIG